MSYDIEDLTLVFEKTDGNCRYCEKQLAWGNYGQGARRGAWVVDHSVPLSRGGTDYFRNLWPACIECNLDKGTLTGSEYMRQIEGPASRLRSPDFGDLIAGIVLGGLALAFLKALFSPPQNQPR